MKAQKYFWVLGGAVLFFGLGLLAETQRSHPPTVDEWRKWVNGQIAALAKRQTAIAKRVSGLEKKAQQAPVQSTIAPKRMDSPKRYTYEELPWQIWNIPIESNLGPRIAIQLWRTTDEAPIKVYFWQITARVPIKDYSFNAYFYKGNRRYDSDFIILSNLATGETIREVTNLDKSSEAFSKTTRIVLYSEYFLE